MRRAAHVDHVHPSTRTRLSPDLPKSLLASIVAIVKTDSPLFLTFVLFYITVASLRCLGGRRA